jgi:hypothetical protein
MPLQGVPAGYLSLDLPAFSSTRFTFLRGRVIAACTLALQPSARNGRRRRDSDCIPRHPIHCRSFVSCPFAIDRSDLIAQPVLAAVVPNANFRAFSHYSTESFDGLAVSKVRAHFVFIVDSLQQ